MATEQERLDHYVKTKGVSCPVCGSYNIAGESHCEVHLDGVDQTIYCGDCGSRWIDKYTLTGVELVETADVQSIAGEDNAAEEQ